MRQDLPKVTSTSQTLNPKLYTVGADMDQSDREIACFVSHLQVPSKEEFVGLQLPAYIDVRVSISKGA